MQGDFMRFGFALPQVGSAVGPDPLVTVAKRAEDLGFDSLWVLDARWLQRLSHAEDAGTRWHVRT